MARLHFFVEGQTEQTFADTLLKRHLANFGVYMQSRCWWRTPEREEGFIGSAEETDR